MAIFKFNVWSIRPGKTEIKCAEKLWNLYPIVNVLPKNVGPHSYNYTIIEHQIRIYWALLKAYNVMM